MLRSILLALSILYTVGISSAQTVESLKSDVSALSDKIKDLDKEIALYNAKIANTQGEAKTLKQALAALESRKNLLNAEIKKTLVRISIAQSKIVDTQGKISDTEYVIAKNQRALGELIRRFRQGEDTAPPLQGLLAPSSKFSDAFDSSKRESDLTTQINLKVGDLKDAKEDLKVTKTEFENNKKELETLSSKLSDQKVVVEVTSNEKARLLTETKNKETEYQKLLEERKVKKNQLEQELLDVESKLKVVVDASKLPKYGQGVLKWPVATVKITQYFGNTPFSSKNPQVYNGAGHNGIDFSAPVGTPIMAAESGVVVGTGNTDAGCVGVSYGKWVLIKHNNGLTTLYAHLSVIQAREGQTVSAGDKIGLSGNTGYSTGPHLHFTVFASDSVRVSGPTEYKSKVCGTYMILPLAPRAGYLNPLTYL